MVIMQVGHIIYISSRTKTHSSRDHLPAEQIQVLILRGDGLFYLEITKSIGRMPGLWYED